MEKRHVICKAIGNSLLWAGRAGSSRKQNTDWTRDGIASNADALSFLKASSRFPSIQNAWPSPKNVWRGGYRRLSTFESRQCLLKQRTKGKRDVVCWIKDIGYLLSWDDCIYIFFLYICLLDTITVESANIIPKEKHLTTGCFMGKCQWNPYLLNLPHTHIPYCRKIAYRLCPIEETMLTIIFIRI